MAKNEKDYDGLQKTNLKMFVKFFTITFPGLHYYVADFNFFNILVVLLSTDKAN